MVFIHKLTNNDQPLLLSKTQRTYSTIEEAKFALQTMYKIINNIVIGRWN